MSARRSLGAAVRTSPRASDATMRSTGELAATSRSVRLDASPTAAVAAPPQAQQQARLLDAVARLASTAERLRLRETDVVSLTEGFERLASQVAQQGASLARLQQGDADSIAGVRTQLAESEGRIEALSAELAALKAQRALGIASAAAAAAGAGHAAPAPAADDDGHHNNHHHDAAQEQGQQHHEEELHRLRSALAAAEAEIAAQVRARMEADASHTAALSELRAALRSGASRDARVKDAEDARAAAEGRLASLTERLAAARARIESLERTAGALEAKVAKGDAAAREAAGLRAELAAVRQQLQQQLQQGAAAPQQHQQPGAELVPRSQYEAAERRARSLEVLLREAQAALGGVGTLQAQVGELRLALVQAEAGLARERAARKGTAVASPHAAAAAAAEQHQQLRAALDEARVQVAALTAQLASERSAHEAQLAALDEQVSRLHAEQPLVEASFGVLARENEQLAGALEAAEDRAAAAVEEAGRLRAALASSGRPAGSGSGSAVPSLQATPLRVPAPGTAAAPASGTGTPAAPLSNRSLHDDGGDGEEVDGDQLAASSSAAVAASNVNVSAAKLILTPQRPQQQLQQYDDGGSWEQAGDDASGGVAKAQPAPAQPGNDATSLLLALLASAQDSGVLHTQQPQELAALGGGQAGGAYPAGEKPPGAVRELPPQQALAAAVEYLRLLGTGGE